MTKKKTMYFLGIDGGGTKTAFMLCDNDGKVINRYTGEGCNPIDIGMERAKVILEEGIRAVCDGMSLSDISVYAGIAGGISGDNREKLSTFLGTFGFASVQNNSDAMNAVAAGLRDRDGAAVIMGTGCVAFTKKGKEYIRTGGFGYLIDAGGDGYSIGRDALRYALYAEQRNAHETELLRLLHEKAGGPIIERLGEIYAGGKAYIASFCPAVFEAMRKGDQRAHEIIYENVRCVSMLITEAAEKLSSKAAVPVVLIGGVARQPEIVPMLENVLRENTDGDRFALSVSDTEPVVGAVLLAMEETKC